jgi:demethylmenaquinone methyltransferase/2-methoxy-6-polyprenyl-1,4-benzoquinol methylase
MTQEMVHYYAERAAEYDDIYKIPPWQGSVTALKEQIPPFFAGRRVFEVACGTGYWTQYAAQHAISVYATDVNETTLAIARMRAYGHAEVTFGRHDAYASHPELGRFNAGLAGFWLSHVDISRLHDFLDAFHAHLEPGAWVLMFDERLTSNRRLPTSRTDAVGNRYEMRQLSSGTRFEIIKNFYDAPQLKECFGEYGQAFSYQELQYFWVFSYQVL